LLKFSFCSKLALSIDSMGSAFSLAGRFRKSQAIRPGGEAAM
jgi:hypothetical protein